MSGLPETDLVPLAGLGDALGQLPTPASLDAWAAYKARLARAQMQRAADTMRADDRPAPSGWEVLENVR